MAMVEREHHLDANPNGGDSRLRRRYEELFELRETRPERDAAQAREALQKSHAASEALIASLRAELAQCKENTQPSNTNVDSGPSPDEAQLRAENVQLRRELELARTASAAAAAEPAKTGADGDAAARLAFYEMITGLRVEMDNSHKIARCAVRGGSATSSSVAAFELHLAPAEGEPDDVEYIPTDLSACAARLPEYLQDSIICTPSPSPATSALLEPSDLPTRALTPALSAPAHCLRIVIRSLTETGHER